MISTCAATVLVNAPSNSAYYSFPSPIHHTDTLQISPSLLSHIEAHHIINTFLFILCVGFLSWSLDSHHQDDEEVIIKKVQKIEVQAAGVVTSTVSCDKAMYTRPPSPTSSSTTTTNLSHEEYATTEITIPSPSSSIRSSSNRSTPSRRNTIENIARLLEVEDRKRQELRRTFSNTSHKAEISPKAIEFGIDGVDVDVNWAPISSIDTEVILLKEIDKELERVQTSSVLSPTMMTPSTTTTTTLTFSPSNILVDSNILKDKDEATVKQQEDTKVETTEELLSEVEIAERRSRSWKTRTLVRLRIPIQWVL